MAKTKKDSYLSLIHSLLATVILATGLIITSNLAADRQTLKAGAALVDPLAITTTPVCTCTGPGVCTRITSSLECQANKLCQNVCSSAAINPPVLVTPNGKEVWERGQTYKIVWEQIDAASSSALFIYTREKNVDTYVGPISYHVSNVLGTNVYYWTIPPLNTVTVSPPDGKNIIVAVAQYGPDNYILASDKSDTPFTIYSP